MSLEQDEHSASFRTDIKPLVLGSDPYKEPKTEPRFGALNRRALLVRTVYLYEGDVLEKRLGDTPVPIRGFIEIRGSYHPGEGGSAQNFLCWGLKNASTGERLSDYSDSGISADPILVFRATNAWEGLPRLTEDGEPRMHEIYSAVGRELRGHELEYYGKQEMIRRRREIASLIGVTDLRRVLQMVPPQLQEMMYEMTANDIGVLTRELERELRQGRLANGEFYIEAIERYKQRVANISQGLGDEGIII